jgi:glycosyltransferase involved in cell wall biosynthesis
MTKVMNNNFIFICPMFNASSTLERLLHSLYGQSYLNWKIYLIDDLSDPDDRYICANIINRFKTIREGGCKHVNIHWNNEKKWEVGNVLFGIKEASENPNDIICRIDADDYLVDLDALYILDEYYKQSGCDIAWTKHRWGFSDKNISGPLSNDVDPYKHPWVTSHLKTFRRYLIDNVPDVNFRDEDGNYFRRAGDQAIYLPCLYNSKNRIFIPRVMYHYTIDDVPETYQTKDAKFQKSEADYIRKRGFITNENII